MRELQVGLGERVYPIYIGSGITADFAHYMSGLAQRCVLITDAQVGALYAQTVVQALQADGLRCEVLTVAAGEASKSFASLERLLNRLLALGLDRKTLVIALGGGVVGDLAGFAASIVLRGIPFVQVPTTLLAMVDSSVGGKTGINTAFGKNLVGSFTQPRAVVIDTDMLRSLPMRELKAGMAEVIKYGLLGDAAFFAWLEAHAAEVLALDAEALAYAIAHCCAMKARIVAEDERESGVRALLNLGHTFAHALEAEAGYDGRLLHGEAVSIGLMMAAQLSVRLGLCDAGVPAQIARVLESLSMPVKPYAISDAEWSVEGICRHFAQDKKAEDGALTFICLQDIGQAMVVRDVPPDAPRAIVEEALQC